MRRTIFVPGEYYHIYNRGIDKRCIFQDSTDLNRFLEAMVTFNQVKDVGSLRDMDLLSLERRIPEQKNQLLNLVCYALLPNHYHMLITPRVENGVSLFMKRLNGGYSRYFNEKYERSGSLFGSAFKAIHVDSNEYLLHVSAYINKNLDVHRVTEQSALALSSWDQYQNPKHWNESLICRDVEERRKFTPLCDRNIILDQFTKPQNYIPFATSSIENIITRRLKEKEDKETFRYFYEA